ncbi:zinc finger protein OZF-like [Myripristis murdjan]|uniref:zinc finger protein OZF-like n=1 Tax=Myripristis murdjan TaxID=586833 RepID=UPI001175CD6C|nr:zinc finger protein OZF-like [Myripristis murdjan]
MSELCELRSQVLRRQTAAAEETLALLEETLAEYQLQNSHLRLKVERQQRLLDAILLPEVRLHRVCQEEVPPEQQEPTPSLEPAPQHIEEEQEEPLPNQQGEQPQDITKLLFTVVPVKSEDDEEEAQWSRDARRSTGQMEAEDGGEERARNPEPSSEAETEDSDDWDETREAQSGSNPPSDVPLSHDRPDVGEEPASCSKTKDTGKSTFPCSLCGKGFSTKQSRRRHMIIHTGEKPFPCSLCGRGFATKQNLRTHIIIHTKEKPFPCSLCGKGFGTKQSLRRHMISHTGEKPYPCSVCGKGFTQEGTLKRHMRIHAGEKPFICSICGNGFSRKGDLTRHMGIHTVEKPFVCSVCWRGFSQKEHLNTHMRIHSGEKPFICSVCWRGFPRNGDLKRHMGIHARENL